MDDELPEGERAPRQRKSLPSFALQASMDRSLKRERRPEPSVVRLGSGSTVSSRSALAGRTYERDGCANPHRQRTSLNSASRCGRYFSTKVFHFCSLLHSSGRLLRLRSHRWNDPRPIAGTSPNVAHSRNDRSPRARGQSPIAAPGDEWKLAFATAPVDNPRLCSIRARNLKALRLEIAKAKKRFGMPEDAAVGTCYEAGRDGFWLHRYLHS
jgi:hypothetical protein